jgi:hypothetical protein
MPPEQRTVEERIAAIERDMDRKLTLREHLMCQIAELPSIDGDDTNIRVKLDATRIKSRPIGVEILEARDVTTGAAVSYGGSVQWTYYAPDARAAYVQITNFPGFASGRKSFVRLAVYGGA